MWKLIYRKLIVTDQSNEVSCLDKNFVPCPMRFSCPAQGRYRENKYVRENRRVKMFAVGGGGGGGGGGGKGGYHAVVCDAFIDTPFFSTFN